MNGLLAGFSLSISLILAIGSQNAFVLRQGLKKEHVFIVCLICAVSDAVLIGLGVSGFSIDYKIRSLDRTTGQIWRCSILIYLWSYEFFGLLLIPTIV